MANKKHIRLETIGDVSQFLSKIINQVYRGEIEGSTASRLGTLLNIQINALRESELENRVKKLGLLTRICAPNLAFPTHQDSA